MRVGRALNRLRARWRLHRMEWNAMHRPLEPPTGYEHLYTKDAVFPGLKQEWQKKETLDDYVEGLKKAWKIYRHDFVYDPEVAKMEQQSGISQEKKAAENAAIVLEHAKRTAKTGLSAADEFLDDVHSNAPRAQKLVSNRINVLAEAMNEFSQGYREGVAGTFKLWDEDSEITESTASSDPSSTSHSQQTRPPSAPAEKHD